MEVNVKESVIDFEPRPLDDHTGSPMSMMPSDDEIMERFDTASEEEIEVMARQRLMRDTRGPDGRELADQFKDFQTVAVNYMEHMRGDAKGKRDQKDFEARQDRNEARWKNEPDVVRTSEGKKSIVKDHHLDVPVTSGLTAAACDTEAAYLIGSVLQSGEEWYGYEGQGKREDNRGLEKVAHRLSEYDVRAAEVNNVMRRVFQSSPKRGMAIVRYRMMSRLKRERDPETGRMTEFRAELSPVWQKWPLKNVLVTNWEEPDPRDQEGVFWITPNTNIHRLEDNEATFSLQQGIVGYDEVGAPVIGPVNRVIEGEFFNLDILRDLEMRGLTDYPSEGVGTTKGDASLEDKDSVTNFKRLALIEYEGALPMYRWIMKGKFTWQMAQALGIELGFADPGEDEDALRDWARRMDQVRQWRLAYVMFGDAALKDPTSGHLIQLSISHTEDMPDECPRNSMYVFGRLEEEDEFLRRSVADRGWRNEDAADALRAARLWATWYNAHPAHLISEAIMEDKDAQNVLNLLVPNKNHRVDDLSNKSVKDLIQAIMVEIPENIDAAIASEEFRFQQATGVFGANMGDSRTATDTARELEMNKTEGEARMSTMLLANVAEMHRCLKDMIADRWHLGGETEEERMAAFKSHAVWVAGADADTFDDDVWSPTRFWKELKITQPLTLGKNKAVLRKQLQEDAGMLLPMGALNPAAYFKKSQALGGMRFVEDMLNEQVEPRDPDDEFVSLQHGERIQVSPAEDLFQHFTMHQQQMAQWAEMDPTGNPASPIDEATWRHVAEKLGEHLMQTQNALLAQMQAAQAQAMAMAAPGASGDGTGDTGGVPGAEGDVMQGLSTSAGLVPGANLGATASTPEVA